MSDLAAYTDDELLAEIGTNAHLIEASRDLLDGYYERRIAMFQEARRRTPPISHARIAEAAGVKTTAAVINALRKAASAAS